MKTLWIFIAIALLMMAPKSRSAGPPFAFWKNQSANASSSGTYSNTVWSDTPYVWLKLDESSGTNFVDRMGHANGQGFPNSGGAWQGGLFRLGGILDNQVQNYSIAFTNFSDTTRKISVGDVNVLEGRPNFTVEAWVNPYPHDGGNQYRYIVSKGTLFSSYITFYLSFNGYANNPEFFVCTNTSGAGVVVSAGADLATNTWHHLVGTLDATTIKFYVNGTLTASSACTSPMVSSSDSIVIGDGSASFYFRGLMDEPAFYTNTLSATTVANHNNAGR